MHVRTLASILRQPLYFSVSLGIAVVVFAVAVWIPNLPLLATVFGTASVAWTQKFLFAFNLLGAITSNATAMSAFYTVAIAILFGINSTLLLYYIRRMRGGTRGLGTAGMAGIGGMVSGFFGIGCAACGTFLLTSLLSLVGGAGLLALLPFGGEEFGFLGVGLLLYSVFVLLKKISDPLVCSV